MAVEIAVNNTKLKLVQGDITIEKVDAIVNAANSGLMGGGGVDGAIHRAGGPAIKEECSGIVARIGRLPAGKAVITTGGNLKAKYVIHTVGPVWHGGHSGEEQILSSCYRESLIMASEHEIRSVSFPAISTGVYGYPIESAARVAVSAVVNYVTSNQGSVEEIHFVLYDASSYNIYTAEFSKIKVK